MPHPLAIAQLRVWALSAEMGGSPADVHVCLLRLNAWLQVEVLTIRKMCLQPKLLPTSQFLFLSQIYVSVSLRSGKSTRVWHSPCSTH